MSRVRRLLIVLAALALAVSAEPQPAHAAPLTNDGGQPNGIVALLAHSPQGHEHRDDQTDRSTDGIATCKAICAPVHIMLPFVPFISLGPPRPAPTHPFIVALLHGLASSPDPPPPRPSAID